MWPPSAPGSQQDGHLVVPAPAVPGPVTLTRAEVEVLAADGTWIGATVVG